MVLQGVASSHLHLIKSMISAGASDTLSGTAVGNNDLDGSCPEYRYMVGSTAGGSKVSAAFQMHVCKCALLTFSPNASEVGGSD